MCCNREDHHLYLHLLTSVAVGRIYIFIFSHVFWFRGPSSSSSHMRFSREDFHLHLLTCVSAERIFIFIFSNMMQPRRSSSQMYCSQEDRGLKYVAVEKIVASNMLQPRGTLSSSSHWCYGREDLHLHLLTCVSAKRIFIFIFSNMMQSRRSSSQMWCSRDDHHLHLHLLTCVAAERIIIFIFSHVLR